MPTEYTVKNNETGQEITFDWNGSEPPTEADMEEVFSAAAPKAVPVSRETKKPGYGQRVQAAIDEQAQRTVKDISSGRNPILPTIRGATGSMAAYVNEAPGIKQITELIGKGVGKAIQAIPGARGAVEKGAAGYQKLPASIRDIVEISGNVGTFVPAAGAAVKVGKAAPGVAAAAGRQVEKAGVESLGGQLKIKQGLAQRGYGNRIDQKKQNILKNISKYNLESMTGNFSKMADNASKMATERVNKADEILSQIAASPDAPIGQFVDDIIMDAMEKIDDTAAIGKEAQAQKVLDDILSGATGRGLAGTGEQGIDAIIQFKRNLDPDGNLFKQGPGVSDADNLDRAIRKQLYRSAVDKIREISPEAADLNKQAKELIDIANVAGDAASRTANPNKVFSMSNMLLGGFGGAGAAALQSPEVAAGTIGALLAKAAGNQGRGPALLMKSGKALQGKNPIGTKGIAGLLKNERGAVGGSGAPSPQTIQAIVDAAERHGGIQNIDMVGTRRSFGDSVQDGFLWYNTPDGSTRVVKINPQGFKGQSGSVGGIGDASEMYVGITAIRDPLTGKVYTGGFRGHRDAVLKGETPDIKERLRQEYFNDSFKNEPTGNIGYIDKSGNFISRAEAEQRLNAQRSPAQMYHTMGVLAGTGAAAGAGLGISELMKGK